jgi:PIN domain nuclease of toxin-antitoxin system
VRLLLDTCVFLWMVADPDRLSTRAASELVDADNDVLLSAASVWEIAVKYDLGKLELDRPPHRYVPEERTRHGIAPLALDEEAALHVHRLPPVHRDPFDRILVCQALAGSLVVVTPDPNIARYPVRTIW